MVKYQELWNEENTNIRERYDLAIERIMEIPSEERVGEPYRSYFNQMAAFTSQIEELARLQLREDLDAFTLEELQQLNDRLYADILPEHYFIRTVSGSNCLCVRVQADRYYDSV